VSLLVAAACDSGGKASGRKGRRRDKQKDQQKKAAKKEVAATQEQEEEKATFQFNETFTGRDPFRSFLADFRQRSESAQSGLAELRTPLETFEITELEPIALITATPVPKAMVEDPSGLGHMIQPGTRIGRRGGKVVRIAPNTIVIRHIEEELGTVKETVLRLRHTVDKEMHALSVIRNDVESEARREAQENKGVLKGLDVEELLKKPPPGAPGGGGKTAPRPVPEGGGAGQP